MKILITGSDGQLGQELIKTCPANRDIAAFDISDLDITEFEDVSKKVKSFKPDVIINAAAYTAVDKAESESELAFSVNKIGALNLARVSAEYGCRMIHVSTDFVFDGTSSEPYRPDSKPSPLGIYGLSKFEGEQAVINETNSEAVIIRTAWVYSSHGNNFVKTMLRLMAEKDSLNVVADQVGTPTWAGSLAGAIWKTVEKQELKGVFHWTDAGVASWYDFAVAIQEIGLELGILENEIPVKPIRTIDYPTPAKRPAYSVLDKTDFWKILGFEANHWRKTLYSMMEELKKNSK